MSRTTLSTLIAIAEKAIELHHLEGVRRQTSRALSDAYREFRNQNACGDYIERETPLYEQMEASTAVEFGVFSAAKADERNARKRLETAIRAHLKGGAQ